MLVIIPLALFQLGTGFTLISLKHYALSEIWIRGSIIGFIILIFSWFSFLYFLFSLKPTRNIQNILIGVCIITVLCMIFFMANKP